MDKILNSPESRISHIETIVQQHPEAAGLQAYEYFRSDIASFKSNFISDPSEPPTPTYSVLTVENLKEIANPAREALVVLMPGEKTPKTESLYDAIEYRVSELSMLSASQQMMDPDLPEDERIYAREHFQLANEGLYGKPDRDVFSGLMTRRLREIDANSTAGQQQLAGIVLGELWGMLGHVDETDYAPYEAPQEVIDRLSALVHERFDELVDHVDTDKEYDVNGMRDALEIAVQKLGGTELGWQVKVIADSVALSVSAHQKLIEVGENKSPIQGLELRQKILHEVGVHAQRAMNAERAGWISAQYGQAGYLDFEEGLASALEDAYVGKFATYGERYYLVAGLALGLDNHPERNFQETYETMWRLFALARQKPGEDITGKQIELSKSTAFADCVRLFRGTSMQDKGVVYLKDLAYLRGQELAWSMLKDVSSQEEFDLLFTGKLDLTKDDHLEVARDIDAVLKRAA